jgi:transposase
MGWAAAPQKREQMVLFSRRLEDALPVDHSVRLLDEILGRLNWADWESEYDGRRGQPPIHPRILAGVILHGFLTNVRSSRKLEEALTIRLDFMWLVEGRTIDHTTLSEFRRKYPQRLREVFVQIGCLARELGWLPLQTLAYDGTRIRSNNRARGSRTPDEWREMQAELRKKYAELTAQAEAEDARDAETFGPGSPHQLPAELAATEYRLKKVDAVLAELQRVAAAGETIPSRVPCTDPQSRVSPNKEGGFAPNYTPLATVDAAEGFIVAADVIAMTNEDVHLVGQLQAVQADFGLENPPPEVLADGAMCSGSNLAALEALGTTLYSPLPKPDMSANPALRSDLTQPVPAADWARLPMSGKKSPQLRKEAFVYDEQQDCYWCPQGQALPAAHKTSELRGTERVERVRYQAEASVCASCPLLARCVKPGTAQRTVSRDQHESKRDELARRMATPAAQAKYKRRKEVAERPFAMIKHHFGVRRFLLRGLDQVRTEWRWLATAFNLQRMMSLWNTRAGPAPEPLLLTPD